MLKMAGMALVAAISAAGASKAMISLANSHAQSAAPAVQATAAPATGQATSVVRDADGHYWAQAQLGDHAVRFLVDTGATAVTLSPADAARLGYTKDKLVFDRTIITANGQARAALVTLPSVSVAGVRVPEVQALVAENGLDTSLLGMTYLGRLSRFEATQTSLILRP